MASALLFLAAHIPLGRSAYCAGLSRERLRVGVRARVRDVAGVVAGSSAHIQGYGHRLRHLRHSRSRRRLTIILRAAAGLDAVIT